MNKKDVHDVLYVSACLVATILIISNVIESDMDKETAVFVSIMAVILFYASTSGIRFYKKESK
ncbi:hypothetical protein PBI_KAMPE_50 [Gordonia phage Kampe]|uniref:Uncharacterized protein n=3 Tax=Gordonia phage Orchid TaxID=1838075 RepID=A0A160DHJ1_9CAUD|nr:hypothetical protein BH761_gp049 [Gordonia phage Orchid]ANA87284.1 hypothetical protein PBI_PATRICKSTAR_50 [Gordonia phage PatrickStar]ANA87396.1 hypothetical protein PBI_ORCHID_49 [Gordonia phage Orchid]ANA87511.1 hypothetical protein PBI_KAMPE_50 [Gordonia phage Kampe]AXH46501.1 hypothetical protein SEA_ROBINSPARKLES_53 [Gordonia phage RobinSparkles]